ncbi:MBOAT family protein [Treponema pallidum subsp. pallidum]|nr:MBOAT family protein [Treponema pallidum subsp. pallidum]
MLLVANFLAIAAFDIRFCIPYLVLSALAYSCGLLILMQKSFLWRKVLLIAGTLLQILFFCLFKHFSDMLSLVRAFAPAYFAQHTWHQHVKDWNIWHPVGISYCTFKCMSYVFDVYLCKIRRREPFARVLLYVSFFPQMISGPIANASHFFTRLPHNLRAGESPLDRPIHFDRAVVLLYTGLVKKVIFADFLSILVTDKIFTLPSAYSSTELLFGLISYSAVLYCDFSGYSDLAIAVGLLFGFETPANFKRPYISQSVTEFWRRWHISFSQWLKEYLYFSLGGSRFGIKRTVCALFFTMLIAGLWHGVRLTFLLWGMAQGVALVIERVYREKRRVNGANAFGSSSVMGRWKARAMRCIRVSALFLFVSVGWLIFRAPSFAEVWRYVTLLFRGSWHGPFQVITPFTALLALCALCVQLPSDRTRARAFACYCAVPLPVKALCAAFFFFVLSVMTPSGIAPFIYYSF